MFDRLLFLLPSKNDDCKAFNLHAVDEVGPHQNMLLWESKERWKLNQVQNLGLDKERGESKKFENKMENTCVNIYIGKHDEHVPLEELKAV